MSLRSPPNGMDETLSIAWGRGRPMPLGFQRRFFAERIDFIEAVEVFRSLFVRLAARYSRMSLAPLSARSFSMDLPFLAALRR